MDITLLDSTAPSWNARLDRVGALLNAHLNPHVFPYHFLQVVLPRLGGSIVEVRQDRAFLCVGFLFPRGLDEECPATGTFDNCRARRQYTLRYHLLGEAAKSPALLEQITFELRNRLQCTAVIPYDPAAPHSFRRSARCVGHAVIGRPDAAEAQYIRHMHQQIWHSPSEYLYPADIHSTEFSLGTSLVARVEGNLAGFLFGFYKFGLKPLPADWDAKLQSDLRLESQTLGILSEYRGMRLANLLKKAQAEQALANDIDIVNWTADPLQYPNAALNFGLLRAVAFEFHDDYYPFRNDLNRVPASRFVITWIVRSDRVRNVPALGSPALVLDLQHHSHIVRVNDGFSQVRWDADAPFIAVEIPADWTALQRRSLDDALRWREVSDRLFQHYVGQEPGQYVITGVGVDHDRRFLIGERVDDALWAHLSQF
ncbi:MAG: hypothetical protein QM346_04485 [Chloroflexota bacterium]|nr:hypothetical protein [Chloroflexota bacterium]